MPLDPTIKKLLIIGSGPIVIGQACEFDYSGTQACKAIRSEGIEVVLINSNPATIMTDPEVADRTYVEPLTVEAATRVIAIEKPDAVLPTLGGQTGLNLAMDLAKAGVLDEHGVRLIGAAVDVIEKAEDRQLFKDAVEKIGLSVPRSGLAHTMEEARALRDELGTPAIIRPAFTLGGTGGGIAWNVEEYEAICRAGIDASPIDEILIEESIIGWKEFELEVMRDVKDNVVIVCSIENIDPMGVHTGDSVTVAPALTLSDREYQRMRDAAIAIMREIGVETGGSNVQFATCPRTGRLVVIEMNPRVSRSSALASKATGFPIAKIAAKLAIGYTLDELRNDITQETPACFEPTIDYVVTKIPRFDFEKFPGCNVGLTTAMKSVGEAMAIGRTFKESFQKAFRSLEVGRWGYGADPKDRAYGAAGERPDRREIREHLATPGAERFHYLRYAFLQGMPFDEVHRLTGIDPWFLDQIRELCDEERALRGRLGDDDVPADVLRRAKRRGYADAQLARMWGREEAAVRADRIAKGVVPTYKLVDTCSAEFEAFTPYLYSTYEDEDDAEPTDRRKVLILGGGPNRIGQGIEFDTCCVHAAMALRDEGFETIMVNSNPETVSTDYDTSDRLYFEPLTFEDVLNIWERERPTGAIVQLGGQTPLNLARRLEAAGVTILGTAPARIDEAEDRKSFDALARRLGLRQPENGTARSVDEAEKIAREIGYPVLVRPSFVLGGRAMKIVWDDAQLRQFAALAVEASPDHPILIDRFLERAIEVDVDAVADDERVVIAGILEHIEEAGVHSGDASMVMPPYSLPADVVDVIRQQTIALGEALCVRGLMNVQFAVQENEVYVLEVNPRASRTVPFVGKATGVPLAKIAARVMVGRRLRELGLREERPPLLCAVKKSVFPWSRFPGCDIRLSPEMKSTGEVMGLDRDFGAAFAKAHLAGGQVLPRRDGRVFITVNDRDKADVLYIARRLTSLGHEVLATAGTARFLERHGVAPVCLVHKVGEGRPNGLDLITNGEVDLIINTVGSGEELSRSHKESMREIAERRRIPCITTVAGAAAVLAGMEAASRPSGLPVYALQDLAATSSG